MILLCNQIVELACSRFGGGMLINFCISDVPDLIKTTRLIIFILLKNEIPKKQRNSAYLGYNLIFET